ncbi:hypothetical protein BJY52DRAFT_1404264 [Lactarius psammicola]|nr:hypothetical protein BJY52DRAFT_1404264 [Lactarius psammicola]
MGLVYAVNQANSSTRAHSGSAELAHHVNELAKLGTSGVLTGARGADSNYQIDDDQMMKSRKSKQASRWPNSQSGRLYILYDKGVFPSEQAHSSHRQPAVTPKFGSFPGICAMGGTSRSPVLRVAESASNATKKFASLLGPPSIPGVKLATSPDPLRPDASGDR